MLAFRRIGALNGPLCSGNAFRLSVINKQLYAVQRSDLLIENKLHDSRGILNSMHGRYPVMIMPSCWRHYANEPSPTPPNLPDRQQVEKFFFRCVAFMWDVGAWLVAWAVRNFQVHVINNPKVQDYYKKLLDKMEESKKG